MDGIRDEVGEGAGLETGVEDNIDRQTDVLTGVPRLSPAVRGGTTELGPQRPCSVEWKRRAGALDRRGSGSRGKSVRRRQFP